MHRREALQTLAILTAGTAMLPGCFVEDSIFGENPNIISIAGPQAEFIEQLAEVILPVADLGFKTPEPLAQFVSNMMNECHSLENITQFGEGYKAYKQYLNNTITNPISGLSPNEEQQLFAALENEDSMSVNAKFFFKKVKQLAQRHFTSSQKYLEAYNDYEYAPGRFDGCFNV